MADQDRFGTAREQRLLASGVRHIFTPHRPVTDEDLLFGRTDEIERLVAQINTPGQHSLLYGERGVGKTSLANVVAQHVLGSFVEGKLYSYRCDSASTFIDIFREPLMDAGIDLELQQLETTTGKNTKAGLEKPITVARSKEASTKATYRAFRELNASRVAGLINEGSLRGLLIVDEADALSDVDDRRRLAEVIKQLSDLSSSLKVIVVGIAEVGAALTGAHPSVARCLKETHLGLMDERELAEVVISGGRKLELSFGQEALRMIVKCSSGYPYWTHLLALKCAENAIAHGARVVAYSDVVTAMHAAVEDAEASLKRSFDDVCRSVNRDSYRTILAAAATIDALEFELWQWRDAIRNVTGREVASSWLSNHIKRLVSSDGSRIITRVGRGFYRFTDPRMPSFILMACRDKIAHLLRSWA